MNPIDIETDLLRAALALARNGILRLELPEDHKTARPHHTIEDAIAAIEWLDYAISELNCAIDDHVDELLF